MSQLQARMYDFFLASPPVVRALQGRVAARDKANAAAARRSLKEGGPGVPGRGGCGSSGGCGGSGGVNGEGAPGSGGDMSNSGVQPAVHLQLSVLAAITAGW